MSLGQGMLLYVGAKTILTPVTSTENALMAHYHIGGRHRRADQCKSSTFSFIFLNRLDARMQWEAGKDALNKEIE